MELRLHWVAFTAEECEDIAKGILTKQVRDRVRRSAVAPLKSFVNRKTGDPVQPKERVYGRRRSS